jgi:isopentenyldiphosphate isomerase
MRLFASFYGMSHERIEVVDSETGHPTGACLPRKDVIATNAWCRSTNIYVVNSHGQILCHQRSLQKERLPGVWSTHLGGHVAEGETYETNAQKELFEESGIQKEIAELIPWRTLRAEHTAHSRDTRLWMRDYVTLYDGSSESLIPQPGEVESFVWMTPDEILESVRRSPEAWCAGTQDFRTEYYCMRAVLTAAHALGAVSPSCDIHAWQLAS